MSGLGNCYDNAMIESFFATLKTECANQRFDSINEARREIAYYIEAWYNRKQRHSSLGYLSPVQYEGAQHETDSLSIKTGQDQEGVRGWGRPEKMRDFQACHLPSHFGRRGRGLGG